MKRIFLVLGLLLSFTLALEVNAQTPTEPLVRWNDGSFTQDRALPNGWIHRTVLSKERAIEGRLYILNTQTNSYSIDVDKNDNVRTVRIGTSTKPGVIEGLFVIMDVKPRILESNSKNTPLTYLYKELLENIEGLPSNIKSLLVNKSADVIEAAKNPATLTPVSKR